MTLMPMRALFTQVDIALGFQMVQILARMGHDSYCGHGMEKVLA